MFVEKSDFETFKFNIRKSIKAKGEKIHVAFTETLSEDRELKMYNRRVLFFDPAGADRIIWLPQTHTLDGSPWIRAVRCQECECGGGHITTKEFSNDRYFFINNMADEAEDLILKYEVHNYTTQTVFCDEAETKEHKIPIYVNKEEYTAMTISQNQGGVIFCNGLFWHGFLGAKT